MKQLMGAATALSASAASSIDFSNPQTDCGFACSEGFVQFRNYWCLEQYACKDSYFGGQPPLAEWVGYVMILGFGIGFGFFTLYLVRMNRGGGEMSSEQFNTAGRTVGVGLTASVLVSQWTWAATLLQSSNVAYQYGISGPFWYAAGATIQVVLFSVLSIQVKRRAPTAHTFLEIIRARWGTTAHIVFLCFALTTNIIVTGMQILGGTAMVRALTGMNIDIASFLIPLGNVVYTIFGGLEATFVASYFNTLVILIALCIFVFKVYATSPELGSPDNVWDSLTAVVSVDGGQGESVDGNQGGSYLTMLSTGGLSFGVINIIGNFGTVFVDQAYWQSAIAATPQASWKGYILGALCWFAIPFTLATSLGLASVGLSLPLTSFEANEGLVPAGTAQHLMGDSGSLLILVMVFMAIVSTGSAELIGVSSIIAYDVYRTYIHPECNGRDIIRISQYVIFVFGVSMGCVGIVLNQINISLGWMFLAMGVFIGSAVFPVACCLMWDKCSARGAIGGALGGQFLALCTWFGYASVGYGGVSVDNLGEENVMLAANLVGIFSSCLICTVVSLINDEPRCDWENTTMAIPLVEQDEEASAGAVFTVEEQQEMSNAQRTIILFGTSLSVLLVLVWPVLTIPAGVFSKPYWRFWVGLSITWGLVSTFLMAVLPVWEAREAIGRAVSYAFKGKEASTAASASSSGVLNPAAAAAAAAAPAAAPKATTGQMSEPLLVASYD
jgi:SSS family transporter